MYEAWQTVYPRPQLRRDSFLCLNGEWHLNGEPIQVPFPPQAPASGYAGAVGDSLHYEKRFTLPEGFFSPGQRVLLHLGAVDQLAWVFLNGRPVAKHEGGYLPFEADITQALQPGENVLLVEAMDALDHRYPYGKQSAKPHGMWYTPFSGIWRSVWLEAVPEEHITGLRMETETDALLLTVQGGPEQARAVVSLEGEIAAEAVCPRDTPVRIPIPDARQWSPEQPVLYRLTVQAGEDTVRSYFGLRRVDIAPDSAGVARLRLNGAPILLQGVLDQGYFPDGLCLPGEGPAAYERDILRMKELGFNTLRMHIKVEDEAFYEACDRLGILVIQDMVQSGHYSYLFDTVLPTAGLQRRPDWLPGSGERRRFFLRHCLDTLAHLHNHPCIIVYTIFNEGWGQHHTSRIYRALRQRDPSRLFMSVSGWFRGYETDLDSRHVYFRNRRLHPGEKPLLLSECGGYARPVEGHLWRPDRPYGYGDVSSPEALAERMALLWRDMVFFFFNDTATTEIYTQLSDVEEEINGLYTYDRQVCKVDADRLRALTRETEAAFRALLDGEAAR